MSLLGPHEDTAGMWTHCTNSHTCLSMDTVDDEERFHFDRSTSGDHQAPYSPFLEVSDTNTVGREGESLNQHNSLPGIRTGNVLMENASRESPGAAEEDCATGMAEPKWAPFYLRPPFLLGQAAVFVLVIAALEALYRMSERNQGLTTASQNLHYLWTYGPTFGM